MVARITVTSNTAQIVREARAMGSKHVPFATARALTWTGKDVQKAEVKEMRRVFDRPTSYTLRSVYVIPAKPDKLMSRVWIKDRGSSGGGNAAADYLLPQIEGGARKHKRFEKRLIRAGILPPNMYAVPGGRATLDKFGNMRAGQIEQILSVLQAAEQFAGYSANQTYRSRTRAKRRGKLRDYFVGQPTPNAPRGVWERIKGGGIRPILIFVREPRYKRRLDWHGVAERTAEALFPVNMRKSLAMALGDGRGGWRRFAA